MSPTIGHCITRLGPRHEADLMGLLLDLDLPSRCSRFACAASDASLIQHSQQALATAAWIAGAFADERLRGVVEVYDVGPPGMVEAAFLIEQAWRPCQAEKPSFVLEYALLLNMRRRWPVRGCM